MTSPELDGLVAELVERSTSVVLTRGRLVVPFTEAYMLRLDGVLIGYVKSIGRLSITLNGHGLVYLRGKSKHGSPYIVEDLVRPTVAILRDNMVLDDLGGV